MIGSGKAVLFLTLVFRKLLFIAACKKKESAIPKAPEFKIKRKQADESCGMNSGQLTKGLNSFSNICIHTYVGTNPT